MFFLWLSIQTAVWVGSGTLFVMTDHPAWACFCYVVGLLCQIPRKRT